MFAASKTASVSGGYQISRSLRFNSADSTHLSRTYSASSTDLKRQTFSFWMKRTSLTTAGILITGYDGSSGSSNYIGFLSSTGTTVLRLSFAGGDIYTTQVFRDPSAWYHIVVALDTTQATDTNRLKLYVNGAQVTSFTVNAWPTLNGTSQFSLSNSNNKVGSAWTGSSEFYDGYMTEVNFIDGQALTPSSFGETNAQTGVWQPKAYSGSYGTNGFYLNFSDNSNTTAATLGKDYSGNGNNWTPNNFSVTAGAGNDSLVDSPTSYGTDTGVGGTVRGNYCTLNPLYKNGAGTPAYTNGNLDMLAGGAGDSYFGGTFSVNSGKWYYECLVTLASTGFMTGICKTSAPNGGNIGSYRNIGDIYNLDGTSVTSGATYSTNDLIGVAIDIDAGTVQFYKNGTAQGATPSFTFTAGTEIFVRGRTDGSGATATFNFGQRPFAYTAPSGYKALCTQNLPTPTIGATSTTLAGKYFNPVLWTGNGSTQTISGVGFQPDFTWAKCRSNAATANILQDVIRGAGSTLFSEDTSGQLGNSGDLITSWNSDGFGVNRNFLGGTTNNSTNGSGYTYVAWNWKANGSGSTNTAGSITSTVSANTTSGFSVVTFTGTGALATVGHGLGVAPYMVIIKRRDGVADWATWHISIGTQVLFLNLTNSPVSGTAQWNGTIPTSSVFTVNTSSGVNGSGGTYVAYCFAPVAGYSAFGQYTGNGSSDGPMVYTGMRPAYLLLKRTDSTNSWIVYDTTRDTYNVAGKELLPDSSAAEATYPILDFLSNGFKIRNSAISVNSSGGTYIYMAFASNPFKYSLAR